MAATKSRSTCSASPCAQQAVVDEDAGELVADGPLHERRGDRGVDAAGQPADRPACRRPARGSPSTCSSMMFASVQVGRGAGDVVAGSARSTCWPCSVCTHLGVELHAGQPRGRRPRTRRPARPAVDGRDREALGRRAVTRVAVAHPDRLRRRAGRASSVPGSVTVSGGAAELAAAGVRDRAAQRLGHRPGSRSRCRTPARRPSNSAGSMLRRAVGVHRRRAAGQDDRLRVAGQHLGRPASCAARSRSRRAPRARGGRSAGRTARRSRRRGRGAPHCWSRPPLCRSMSSDDAAGPTVMSTMTTELRPLIRAERAALADDLAELSPAQWATRSLCTEWTVEETVAHLVAGASIGPLRWFSQRPRRPRRASTATTPAAWPSTAGARRRRPSPASGRSFASTTSPPGPGRDVARRDRRARRGRPPPPGPRPHAPGVDPHPARDVLREAELHGAQPLDRRGSALEATDGPFTTGPDDALRVTGPTLALVMAMAGRAAFVDDLAGPGVRTLRARCAS